MSSIEFIPEDEKATAARPRQKTTQELEEFFLALKARPDQWAVFSYHSSPGAASGRRNQVSKAKRYANYPVDWSTRRMPTESNPHRTVLAVRWCRDVDDRVYLMDPPPVGTVVIDQGGSPWRLYDWPTEDFAESKLTWCALHSDAHGKAKSQRIEHAESSIQVSQFRIIYTPPKDK